MQMGAESKIDICLKSSLKNSEHVSLLLGDVGIVIAVYNKLRALIASAYISYLDSDYHQKCASFLKRYKKYPLAVILDNSQFSFDNIELIPNHKDSDLKQIKSILNTQYPPDSLKLYQIHDDDSCDDEIINNLSLSKNKKVSIFTSAMSKRVESLLSYVLDHSNYYGVYFAPLEYIDITLELISNSQLDNNISDDNSLNILVATTQSNGIKIAITHAGYLLAYKNTLCKNEQYNEKEIYNSIEALLSDMLKSLDDIISSKKLAPQIVFLLPVDSNPGDYIKLPYQYDSIVPDASLFEHSKPHSIITNDLGLISLFRLKQSMQASSTELEKINRIDIINKIVITPALIVLLLLMVTFAAIHFDTWLTNKQNIATEKRHNEVLKQIHSRITQYAGNKPKKYLIDEYYFDNITRPKAHDAMNKLLSIEQGQVELTSVIWRMMPIIIKNNGEAINSIYDLDIKIKYEGDIGSGAVGLDKLNRYYEQVKNIFPSREINYNKDDLRSKQQPINISNRLFIGAKISLKSKGNAK